MSEQTPVMPPAHRAPLDPWPSQAPFVPDSDEPLLPNREAGPDEPLEERKPARTPTTPGSEGRPSPR
jgi:hypothetical protein